MTKTLEPQPIETITHPSTISELATHFLKGESWVKNSKSILKEAYWWMTERLFDESGSLTGLGFEKMCELFDRASNTRIVTQRGKRVSKRQKPQMSVEEFKTWVWTNHRKFPQVFALESFVELVADPDTDQSEEDGAIVVEFEEAETSAYDATAQVEENIALVLSQGGLVNQRNQTSFDGALQRLEAFVAAKVESVIVTGVTQGQNRGMARAVEAIESGLPTDVKPVKTRKKSSSGKPASS